MNCDYSITLKNMEKKYLYSAPAVRFVALSYDSSFLTSTGTSIDPWENDSDEIDF